MELSELFYPRQVVLITSSAEGRQNVSTVEWFTPINDDPFMVAFSIKNSSMTFQLISSSLEFLVAIPTEKLKESVSICGMTSGKYINKFEEAKLTPLPAKKVSAPLIKEAYANIEFKVLDYKNVEDHTVFIGEAVEVHYEEEKEELLLFNDKEKLFGFKKNLKD
jgi:flavin reductase (DIM6/NTAB) family NADH-FMN oxidoreductase RutF